jgi:hypothetical protein
MSNSVSLAVFTNCTDTCLTEPTIYDTLASLIQAFRDQNFKTLTVYCDPHPNPKLYKDYVKKLESYGFYVVKTKSLSDGWKQAIEGCKEDYLFLCEHDWLFLASEINHKLFKIIRMMNKNKLWYMRFNKRDNIDDDKLAKWQSYFKQGGKGYCLTDNISNNPHIINVAYYKEHILTLVDWSKKGAGMIEQSLQKSGLEGAVYGDYGKLPTIKHLDGRKGGLK